MRVKPVKLSGEMVELLEKVREDMRREEIERRKVNRHISYHEASKVLANKYYEKLEDEYLERKKKKLFPI